MNVNVLTSGYWPSYPHLEATLPDELTRYQAVFKVTILVRVCVSSQPDYNNNNKSNINNDNVSDVCKQQLQSQESLTSCM